MLKLSPLSIGLLAFTIAAPVFAADLPGTIAKTGARHPDQGR